MNREKRERRLQLKCQLERLETRWLMRASAAAAHVPLADAVARRASVEIEQWLNHHPTAAVTLDLSEQRAEFGRLAHSNMGNWGALRVLTRIEASGDHRFDLLYQNISVRFGRWAASHPIQARLSGLTAAPLQPVAPIIPIRLGAGSTPPLGGLTPNGGPPPPLAPHPDNFSLFVDCNCGPTANQLLNGGRSASGGPPNNQSGDGGDGDFNGGRIAAGGGGGGSGPMDSDAQPITGEFLQDHQLATYQSQGQDRGIDLQYSSLDADPYPIVTAFLTTVAGSNSALITSITASMTVNGASQGSAVTYNSVSLTDGATYIVQLQATTVSSYATGIYPVVMTITKYFSDGTNHSHDFDSDLMVVDDAASPYGAGWSIGGLQQLTIGTAGTTLMIRSGSDTPEEFSSTDGAHYAGNAADVSTLTYDGTSHTYTRAYSNGSTVIFNSTGQETSAADSNGNTTSYAYVTSGAAAGALQTITDPLGQVTTLAYNGTTGKLATVTDPISARDHLHVLKRQAGGDHRSRPCRHLLWLQFRPGNDNREQSRPPDRNRHLR